MSELTIANTDFLTKSLIERCPNTMMLRELVANAIEAASESSKKLIRIKQTLHYKTPKLTIWNTGRGMTPQELRDACNLSSSIRKENSLSENYGMGAKVASLAVNQLGIRFRSCYEGKVSEVVMALSEDKQRNKKYMRLDYDGETLTDFQDVADVTKHILKEGDPNLPSEDWTEVTLYGNEVKQNTVTDPFNNNPKVPKLWIANSLYHRFYRLPKGVEILLEDGTQAKGGPRKFLPFPQVLENTKGNSPDKVFSEEIKLEDGIKVHYSYDSPNQKSQHNATYNFTSASDVSFCGIVFKGEIYDFKSSNKWYNFAPSIGIPFGSKHISIFVELTDEANVQPEAYREELRWNDNEKRKVSIAQFSEEIINNIPEWLKDKVAHHTPKHSTSEDIRKQLQDLIKEMSIMEKVSYLQEL